MQKYFFKYGDTHGDTHRGAHRDTNRDVHGDKQRNNYKKTKMRMRIGHQLYCYLQDWTDAGHYDVQQVFFFRDNFQRVLCIKSLFINEDENQVYLVLEDVHGDSFLVNVHHFLCMMGGAEPDSYKPLYRLRDELSIYRKRIVRNWKKAKRMAAKNLEDNNNHIFEYSYEG